MRTVSRRLVYANRWLSLREDTVRRRDGSIAEHCVVRSADIALVIPVAGGRLHLVEQYRHPVDGRRWEFPSGSVDPERDADPAAAARRELQEETGLMTGQLIPLGTLEISPSTLDQRCTVFLATDLAEGPSHRDPEEADLRSTSFSRGEVERMISGGDLTDAKSCAAYALLLLDEALHVGRPPVSRHPARHTPA